LSYTTHPFLEVKKPFGAAVKNWPCQLGISQDELAARAGLHRTYISDIERGARNPSLETIEKLASALEISTPTLFSYEPLPRPRSDSDYYPT
jgi:transcriptional regulator with XRE-family HTH domain